MFKSIGTGMPYWGSIFTENELAAVVDYLWTFSMRFLEDVAGRRLTLDGLLESIRLSEELSQAAFVKKLGISVSHLCDIEKGRKVVSAERAARFARILGRSEEQFVRFALQEMMRKAGLKLKVDVVAA
jgi:plasmid maintenance system antidote protein VapI